jgi:hypothetical protein
VSGDGGGAPPVRLGTLLITLVEPDEGHEVAYNRWYERDHFYAGCLVGAHCFAGDRFVATRRLKALRYPSVSDVVPDPADGSYVALYWILEGHHADWNRWAVDQVNRLHAEGRMFPHRRHVHTQLYEHRWSQQRDPDGCPIELALDRDYAGLVLVAGDVAPGHTLGEVDDWFRNTYLPSAMAGPDGPDVVAACAPLPLLDDAPGDVGRPAVRADRFVQLHFLDHDPGEGWAGGYARLGEALAASGLATLAWAGPFIQTVVGTDRYTDELR